jgi:hypothetical protein
MNSTANQNRSTPEAALSSDNPARELMEMAKTCTEKRDIDGLFDIDVTLTGMLVDYIRKGTEELLDAFIDDITAFLGGKTGDMLRTFAEGERYFYRWEQLLDLSGNAIENYDPDMTARFIASRKHGNQLLRILHENSDGVRLKDLAGMLALSNPYLVKLLYEFEEHDLVKCEKGKKMTIVHLGFMGRVHMSNLKESDSHVDDVAASSVKVYISKFNIKVPVVYLVTINLKIGVHPHEEAA